MEGTEQETPVPETNEQVASPVEQPKKEDGVKIPISIVRWFCYTTFFMLLLMPFVFQGRSLTVWQHISIATILGHFAGQLNKLIDK